ncbi:MAG: hypothetical protein R2911_05940 [Caldilineaceae bacterium]
MPPAAPACCPRGGAAVDFSSLFESVQRSSNRIAAPQVSVRWAGWKRPAAQRKIRWRKLMRIIERAGRAVTLALMVLGREVNY